MAFDNKCKWSYDSERDRLTAILPNYTIIETTLNKEVLNRDGMGSTSFEVDDFDLVNRFIDVLAPLQLSEDICHQLAYSAVACRHFLLPKQQQNWFFSLLEQSQMPTDVGLAKCLISQSQMWATLLVADIEENIASVIVLDEQIKLPYSQLQFGDVFRININRLESLMIEVSAPQAIFQQYA